MSSRFVALAVLVCLAPAAAAQHATVVAPAHAARSAPADARDVRAVDIDIERLAAAALAGEAVTLDVGSARVTTSPERVDWRGTGRFTWFGPVVGGGRATLTVERPHVYARVLHAAGLVMIEPSGEGHVAYSPAPVEGEGDDAIPAPVGAGHAGPGADELFPDELHVALFYTERVADSLGAGAVVFMQATVDQLTDVLANSNLDLRARLVHTSALEYTESSTLGGSLGDLQGSGDGEMDEVHDIRDAVSADLVALLVETGTNSATGCGVAYLMGTLDPDFESAAFSVTKRRCAPDLVFSHEVGHNLGLHHDILVAPGPGLYAYSHGFVNVDSINVPPGRPGIRTPLAYHQACADAGGECVRIPYFSTPEQLYNGQVIGDAATADNVRTVRDSGPLTATFRAPARFTTDSGTTAGAATWQRPTCPDPSDLSACLPSPTAGAVPYAALPFTVSSAGRHYVRSAADFGGVLVLYAGAFDAGAPLAGLAGYAEPDPDAPESRRLLLPADLAPGTAYVLVTTGLANADAGAFANDYFGPAGGGVVVAATGGAPDVAGLRLGPPVPNPVAATTLLALTTGSAQHVLVEVFDALGRRVATLHDGPVAAGASLSLAFSTDALSPGPYVVRATGATGTASRRLTVAR